MEEAAGPPPKRKVRYAQIVMGLKGHGKSTYCKLMAKAAESMGRKMRIINLDPTVGVLAYEHPLADIRDHISLEKYTKIVESAAEGEIGKGFEYVLKYVLEHPDWLFGAIGDSPRGDLDYFLFDCPGEEEFHAHLSVLKLFATMLVVKHVRTCSVFVRDSRQALNGYSFIASCLTPLVSYVNLSIPHVCVMMKVDLLNEDDKAKLQLFINSDIKEILRYENTQRNSAGMTTSPSSSSSNSTNSNPPTIVPSEMDRTAHFAAIASVILDGHSLVRKKYFAIDIRDEGHFKSFISSDEVMGITADD